MLLEFPINIGTIPMPGNFNLYTRKQPGGAANAQQPLPVLTNDVGMQQIRE
jgi:hypothetical protein